MLNGKFESQLAARRVESCTVFGPTHGRLSFYDPGALTGRK